MYAEKVIVTDYESLDSKILYCNIETRKLINKRILNSIVVMQIYPGHVIVEPKMWWGYSPSSPTACAGPGLCSNCLAHAYTDISLWLSTFTGLDYWTLSKVKSLSF